MGASGKRGDGTPLTDATRQRLQYIELMAWYAGVVSRSDVVHLLARNDEQICCEIDELLRSQLGLPGVLARPAVLPIFKTPLDQDKDDIAMADGRQPVRDGDRPGHRHQRPFCLGRAVCPWRSGGSGRL